MNADIEFTFKGYSFGTRIWKVNAYSDSGRAFLSSKSTTLLGIQPIEIEIVESVVIDFRKDAIEQGLKVA